MLDSPIVAAIIRSAVVPSVGVAVLFLLLGALSDPWRTRLQALVFALGFMVGAYLLLGRFSFPPPDVSESFGWAGLVLAGFVFVNPRPVGARYLIRGLIVLLAMAVLLWPLRATLSNPIHHRNILAFICLGLGVWSITERSAAGVRVSTLLLLPFIAATALSMLMLFRASASFSQLVTIVAALLAGLAVLGFVFPSRVARSAVVPFASLFVILFMIAGHFYLDINPWHMIYLCLPFLILWIRGWLSFIPSKPVVEELVLGALAAAPLGYFLYGQYVAAGPLY